MENRFLKPSLRHFAPYTPGQQPPDGEHWVKLNTNESPYPPSPAVLAALRDAVDGSLRLYPNPVAAPAREAAARRFRLRPEQVAVGNGSDELIAMCFRAFLDAGQAAAFATPTYTVVEPLCGIHQVRPSRHPMGEERRLPASLADDPAPLKYVVNPNSPTGSWYSREELEPILERSAGVVVLDEAYVDFAPESRLDLLDRHPNLLILRTLSKSYALCGMRIGFALGQPELIAALDMVKDSYNVNRLSIVAAVAALEDPDHQAATVARVVADRTWLEGRLAELGFRVDPSAGNFVFVQPPPGHPAGKVQQALRERRILVRHYDNPAIAGWLRMTVGTREELETLLAALSEILDE